MTQRTETILDRIVADKREELAAAKARVPLAELRERATNAPPVRPFVDAIRGEKIRLIAEVKKASPSKGLLRADFDPAALARAYADGGAAAISVLTDEKHFHGKLADLEHVHEALPEGPPLLRKDFVFDQYQVHEARRHGADALLLIAAILGREALADLTALAGSLGMAALAEAHDEAEVERALAAGAELIGINPLIPAEKTVVAESGVFKREDVRRLERAGVNAVLIGEALVTAPDPAAMARELLG
jgi:indole-3-glycerol phosphate synthase